MCIRDHVRIDAFVWSRSKKVLRLLVVVDNDVCLSRFKRNITNVGTLNFILFKFEANS